MTKRESRWKSSCFFDGGSHPMEDLVYLQEKIIISLFGNGRCPSLEDHTSGAYCAQICPICFLDLRPRVWKR